MIAAARSTSRVARAQADQREKPRSAPSTDRRVVLERGESLARGSVAHGHQPMRMPARPNAFDMTPRLIARSEHSAAGGSAGALCSRNRYTSSEKERRTVQLRDRDQSRELVTGELRSGGAVWRVDDDDAGVRTHGRGDGVDVERPILWIEPDEGDGRSDRTRHLVQ
jgi:hypothetical protein